MKVSWFAYGALLSLAVTMCFGAWLYHWTMDAFYPQSSELAEALAKPWRPWARLAFSAIMFVGLLVTEVYVLVRSSQAADRLE
jgi:hypothetical protein